MVLSEVLIVFLSWAVMAALLTALEHYSSPPCSWDIFLLTKAFEFQSPGLNRFFLTVTLLGSIFILAPVAVLIVRELNRNDQTGSAWLLASSLGGACLVANLGKRLFKRKRPGLFSPIGEKLKDGSFPSAHSAQIAAFMAALDHILTSSGTQQLSWMFAIMLLIVIMVALSRIYLQVHYPSDIMAGIMVGLLWFGSVKYFLESAGITTS